MENHQIWARNLSICGQKLSSAAPSLKMQLRTNPRINDTPDDRPNHEIHQNHQFHQISLVVAGLPSRCPFVLIGLQSGTSLAFKRSRNDWLCWVRSYEMECRRSPCGCDAVQHVSVYSEKLGNAITFAASAAGNGKCCLRMWVRQRPVFRKSDLRTARNRTSNVTLL